MMLNDKPIKTKYIEPVLSTVGVDFILSKQECNLMLVISALYHHIATMRAKICFSLRNSTSIIVSRHQPRIDGHLALDDANEDNGIDDWHGINW